MVTSVCLATLLFVAAVLLPASAVRNQAFIGYTESKSTFDFIITLDKNLGRIRIKPRNDISPNIVKLVQELANKGSCPNCNFYRHEPVPEGWGKEKWFWGPPYALLQGSLQDMSANPPFEGNPVVKKGDVCIIPGSREFFIATADHDEWGQAHSVWGKVDDPESWATIARAPVEPFTTITDKNNITTRWLTQDAHIKFTLSIEKHDH